MIKSRSGTAARATTPVASDEKDHFVQGASWAQDRRDALFRSRRTAWLVAGAATVVAVCEALALVALLPLKTVVPYTLMVDRQTGYVQALKPLDAERVAPDRALTQSFLMQYVIAREGFDYDTVQSDYRKVGLWSAGQARADYLTAMQPSNPASPLALYPRTTTVAVEVKSVTPLGSGVALVRYDTQRRDAGGTSQPARAWVAVIRYGFSGEPLSTADRFVNPLGFQVRAYRRSEETLPIRPAPSPAATSPTTEALP